jgi:hypothetical protein
MYLTNQNIPEGYAKILVNFDIDDTGSCIKSRKGRKLHLTVPYAGYHKLGALHVADYLYTYNSEGTDITDIKDIIMSFGTYGSVTDYLDGHVISEQDNVKEPVFVSKFKLNIDTNVYDDQKQIVHPGEITTKNTEDLWTLYCNKGSEDFNVVNNANIGYVSARTIKNAYVFDKKVIKDLGLPISTVLANEIYAFSGPQIEATIYTANEDLNQYDALQKADLTKLKILDTGSGFEIRREVIQPRTLNPTEAAASGYNMLLESPFLLDDADGGSPKILSLMLYQDEAQDIPVFAPEVGRDYSLRVYYQYASPGNTYEYKLEVGDGAYDDITYDTIVDWTTFTTGSALYLNFLQSYNKTAARVTIRVQNQSSTESSLVRVFQPEEQYKNVTVKEFDLTTAKGMVSWMGCVGLYGVKDATNTIFFSDVEDPGYFPFPYNIVTFDNEILAVHNYLDMLLVITTDSIVLVTTTSGVANCVQKKIMTNIFIPEIDAVNAVVLKDQIFFKTDTQFYVLKPNTYTSDATDLKNFTNSTAIANYTIKFTEETIKILNRVFRPIITAESEIQRKTVYFTDFDVINVQSVVKNEEVHYVYTIVPYIENKSFGNLDLHLVYNTVTRSYRIYLKGIGDDNVSHSAKLYRNKQSGEFYEIIPYNLDVDANVLIVKESLYTRDDNIIQGSWQLTPYYNNYNYLDTGNVAIDDTYNKRYRELQMNVVNHENSKIRFYTDVKVDGKLNVTSTRYDIRSITDPEDPEYGLVYVVPTEVDDYKTMMTVYGNTTLEDEETPPELIQYWEVDLSAFPELDMATIKLKLYGKGRRAAFQLLCTDLKVFELSTFVWVYRVMNVR